MTLQAVQPWLWLPGVLLIGFVLDDVLTTSLQGGEGRLTAWTHRAAYAPLRLLYRLSGDRRVLDWSGSALVLVSYLMWCLLTWVGWTLIFWSQPDWLLWADSGRAPGLADVAYYTGYTLTTLGYGDLLAQTPAARLFSTLESLNGFFILTFTITFLAPLADLHSHRRALALRVYRWGPGPHALVLRALRQHPDGAGGLLNELEPALIQLETKHHTAMYLHRLHDSHTELDLNYALPALGDALLLLQAVKDPPPPGNLPALYETLSGLNWSYHLVQPRGTQPLPPLSLEPLREAGLDVISDQEFEEVLARESTFRRGLYDMAERAGYDLSEVVHPRPKRHTAA
ncbi:potassium channel family protein [Deinococcus sp. Marseille-Q6407]|uniref:potassium channel family protein n=1 Tax=Deinococcus sp. Marseille-Q6407 TaxID=2969223 RepID=UPI0021C0A494|nr:potassium channel family protein [Deinococcus sp. Marseille-Q6407]